MKKNYGIIVLVSAVVLLFCQNNWIFPMESGSVRTGPVVSPTMTENDVANITCGICLYAVDSVGNDKFVLLPCHATHAFHRSCLEKWFRIQLSFLAHQVSCPYCRKEFFSTKLLDFLPDLTLSDIQAMLRDHEFEKEFGLYAASVNELLRYMPRSYWERIHNPRTAGDWMCRGCLSLCYSCLWDAAYVAGAAASLGIALQSPEDAIHVIRMDLAFLGNDIASGVCTGEWGEQGCCYNLIYAYKAFIQAIRQCQAKHREEHAHDQ